MPPVADPASRPPTGRRRSSYVAAAALLLVVAVVTASAAGTRWQMTDRFGIFGDSGPPPSQTVISQPPGPMTSPQQPVSLSSVLAWVLPIGAVAVLFLIWWVFRGAFRRRRLGRYGSASPVTPTPADATDPAPALRRGFQTAEQLLDTVTDPDDAVLRAWVALEEAAEQTGLPRLPSATPTEFTVEVIVATEADIDAVHELLALYHRARFSPGGLGAADLENARNCLRALGRSWSRFETTLLDRDRVPGAPATETPRGVWGVVPPDDTGPST
jgi:hypothetical protein